MSICNAALLCFGVTLLLVLSSLCCFSLSNLTSHYVFSFVGEPTGVAVTMSDLATQAFSFPPPTADPDFRLLHATIWLVDYIGQSTRTEGQTKFLFVFDTNLVSQYNHF